MTRIIPMTTWTEFNTVQPVLERHYPVALQWPPYWTGEQLFEVIAALGKGETSKAKRAARGVLAEKLGEVGYAIG